jgi:caffeoyl-CoA O-methyltransferase
MTDADRLAAYVRGLFAEEDAPLADVRRRQTEAQLPEIAISPEEGKLVAVLLTAIGARRVLEVGALGGYSGLWMVRALPADGTLITIERDARRAAEAEESFRAAGLSDRVELLVGEAQTVLGTLTPPFDAVFLDADKAPLPGYYDESMRLLRVGGLLLCDNTFLKGRVLDEASGDVEVRGMRTFNARAASDARLAAAVAPIRDGLLIGVKVGD